MTKPEVFPRTPLIELKKDQIIYFREKPKDGSKKSKKDLEVEKFEEIIIKNSTCMFEFGKGK